MLNYDKIVSRIKEIMLTNQLNAADFSKKIGVQRSSVSHILSGRNKPSLDFLSKIQFAFDDIEFDWLLLGNLKKKKNSPTSVGLFDVLDSDTKTSERLFENVESNTNPQDDTKTQENTRIDVIDQINVINQTATNIKSEIEVKEIIYIYSDNSFKLISRKTD